MARVLAAFIACLILLVVAACSGYRDLPRPWYTEAVGGEFSAPSVLRGGDRLRLTPMHGGAVEGIFVELDEFALTIADTSGKARLISTPVEQIEHLEVFRSGIPGKSMGTIVAVGAATAIIYAIVESESGTTFQPDHHNGGALTKVDK